MKDELIKQAGFSNTFERDRLYKLIDLTVKECINLVKQTPNTCGQTSYDISVIDCTIQKSLDQITTRFHLSKEQRN